MKDFVSSLANHRLRTVTLLGFASGLPLALSGSTLQAWLASSGVDLVAIGFLTLTSQPYVYKFLWAPLLDRFWPPFLGRRRGWMIITQIILMVLIAGLSLLNPNETLWYIGVVALAIAMMSATQDIALDAYRTELLPPRERGLGAALSTMGYRVAMLASGGVALIFADYLGWQVTFLLLSLTLLIGIYATVSGPEPDEAVVAPHTLKEAVIEPFHEFITRNKAWLLLAFIILYKFGDAFAGVLSTAFLIRDLDFAMKDIGAIYKGVGLVATLIGVFLGGVGVARMGLFKSLLLFGIFQAFSNLCFMALAMTGKHYGMMIFAISVENLTGGMGTAAFLACLMHLCDHRYTATQFALLSALASIGRVFIGPVAGVLVESIGWVQFFFWTFIFSWPGILVLWWVRKVIRAPVLHPAESQTQT